MLVQAQNLRKTYGTKVALDDVSFSLDGGQVLGLLGLNGAGKSTVMNILTGCISPSGGSATIGGYNIVDQPRAAKRLIGYAPELLAFYPEMRVNEYLDFSCDLKEIKKDRKQHVDLMCERVGITNIRNRLMRNLSRGYKQRVSLCQAMLGNPKLLVLDEPTAGLDLSQVVEIRSVIRDIGKECIVIVSSHILHEIQEVSSRIIVLHEGRLIADRSPKGLESGNRSSISIRVLGDSGIVLTVLQSVPGVVEATLVREGEPNAYDYIVHNKPGTDVRPAIFRALAKADLPILLKYGEESYLEDVFLDLIHAEERKDSMTEV